jgi:hypothetical protein
VVWLVEAQPAAPSSNNPAAATAAVCIRMMTYLLKSSAQSDT